MSYNKVSTTEIPEVQAFEEAKEKLLAFKGANPKFFEVLDALVLEYNTTREAADKAVRARKASCGDFDYYQRSVKFDAKGLHDSLGREKFLAVGGSIKMEAEYKVDSKKLQLAVARKEVDAELVTELTTEEARYHSPKALSTP